ncbi:hypothetical protein [Goodfellowiella coeruleoviolacea]|uniref:Uncharacterized protein n=1 Tax=Goodfellowiella coeruleoviolacea TaxID=334858 RepID=A0AAE3GKH7_9PSEU|nr:hypothetical protein [Goodfellowiella coeruleoviolacea]MCP2169906.1 hypothetical protein [Goodfellowiella coeruleoviolacea]
MSDDLAELRQYVVEEIVETREPIFFGELVYMVTEITRATDSSEDPRRRARDVAAQLVREGTLRPGEHTGGTFVPWPTGPEESADRILAAVDALIRDNVQPLPGQVCYLDLPAR